MPVLSLRRETQGRRSTRGGDQRGQQQRANASGGAIYGLGIFGAWVWFWQQADGFWEYAYAVFQGIFWPAYMVYEAFAALD